jgi:acyl-CoA reductase-like NAD-dependent aldehyde dehydrogenase
VSWIRIAVVCCTTILTDVRPEMEVAQEEIFGPVLSC